MEARFRSSSEGSKVHSEIEQSDCVARSLNAAASRHRERLLNRCLAKEGTSIDCAAKGKKKPARGSDVSHEEQLLKLHEDCHAMHAKLRGRMATMSSSLDHHFLNQ